MDPFSVDRAREPEIARDVWNPLGWSVIERCRLLVALPLPFYVGYALRSAYLIHHPEIEPYWNRDWLVIMRDAMSLLVAFWIVFLLWGTLERRRSGEHTPYVLVGIVSWWVGVSLVAYSLGPITSPAWIAILTGGVLHLLLLPRALAWAGIGVGAAFVLGGLAGAAGGAVPYAPMMVAPPFAAGRIDPAHVVGATMASVTATLVVLAVVEYVVGRWRDTHAHVTRLNVDLERIVEERTRELVAAGAQLRQAEKMEAVGRLAGGIAHDFNNVLAVITCCTDLLLEAEDSRETSRQDLLEIKRAAGHAAQLVGQLLAVGRRQVMEPQLLDLSDVVRQTVDLLRPLIGEDVELRLHLDDEVGMVEADPVQMQQLLLNLASNARDAMPGGGVLTVQTANLDVAVPTAVGATMLPPGSYVTLAVTDTGRGMDPQHRERAFDPFFTTKERGRGTGLGLSSVQGIVEQSGGWLSLESAVGQGSSFCIYLPRLARRASEPEVRPAPRGLPACSGTLLVVEDDAALRRLLQRTLAAQGHAVLAVADGDEALDLVREHRGRIDAVLTDVILPRGSGRTVAEEVAKRHPEARVIFMTGYTDDAVLLRGISAHEVKLLRKPFALDELGVALAEVLGSVDR